MTADRWLWIPRWEEFQHYQHRSSRVPPWVKNYTDLLHKDAYLELTLHQRGVLHGLWLSFAAARRQIPDSTAAVSRQLGHRVSRATLVALNHAGFLEFVDTPTLKKLRLRGEERREEPPNPLGEGEQSLRESGNNSRAHGTNPRAVAAHGKREQGFVEYVHRFWDEYPNLGVLVDELTDRGCERVAAQAIVDSELKARPFTDSDIERVSEQMREKGEVPA